jgi:AcrR family transcriptional regulator
MGSARATKNNRLSVDDWIQAGFAILAEEGIKALKIDRLCRRLEVTKGSFYWHFTDIAGYRAALVQAWGELRDDDRRHFGELAGLPPRERLSEMMSSLVSARHWTLERAMREWARTDDAAAASVCAADHRVARGGAPGLSGLRVRRRRGRPARERHFRRRHRLPAPRWPAAQRTRRRRPGRLPGDHAQALTPFRPRLPYQNVWCGFMPCPP